MYPICNGITYYTSTTFAVKEFLKSDNIRQSYV